MSLNHFICLVIICGAPLPGRTQHEDFYTSVGVLGKLIELERHLLHNLRDYVDQEVAKNQQIVSILEDFESENAKALHHSREFFADPINVFKAIKRSAVDLPDLGNYITDGSSEELYRAHVAMNESFQGVSPPNRDDFKGAVLGLERMQTTYGLDTAELANGKFYGLQQGPGMSASDAFYMAVDLFHAAKFERSLEWALNALEKFNSQTTDKWEFLSRSLILEWICAAALESKKPDIARNHLTELLQIDPGNKFAMASVDNIEAQFFEARNAPKYRMKSELKGEPTVIDLYHQTCRGERRKSPAEERLLRCMYVDNNHPFLKIGPIKMEQLNLDPMVVYFHEVIYESEIEQIKTAATQMSRSYVRNSTISPVRTSKNTWLDQDYHEFLIPLMLRMIYVTNSTDEFSEELQLANYGIGGHYGPHYDHAANPDQHFGVEAGNRMATALFYLSDVEYGGATAFPLLELAVRPIRRSMVFWYNIHDSGEADQRTLHAACPVLKGSKWILTQWIHERGHEFLRPCGLQRPNIPLQDTRGKV